MQWLNKVVDEVVERYPEGEIIVSSGVSPSGKYHVGTLREVLTADAVLVALKKRGREAKHIHVVDDLDVLRKIPADLPAEFDKYLGQPLCDIPAPDGSDKSYADYYLSDFTGNIKKLGIEADIMRSHLKYREGFFVPAIEKALSAIDETRKSLETISGRKLGEEWSPIQVNEDGYLKKRPFISIDEAAKTIDYSDKAGQKQTISYAKGDVKLDWRIDWPARWWLLGVEVEPFGRDHATKGGSYDTGADLVKKIFDAQAPLPIPFNFINRAGETKKMSKSAGNTVTVSELLEVLPTEIVRFFVLRFAPDKPLFFDQTDGLVRLIDEYAELLAKPNKTMDEELAIFISSSVIKENTVSSVPFSHLVSSYQAALKDPTKTLEIIERTEAKPLDSEQKVIIKKQLTFIDRWLEKWAPEDVKFQLANIIDPGHFSADEKDYLAQLADKIAKAPAGADGEWFHKAVYELKGSMSLTPQQVFKPLYRALINKESGPRAGWFLSILPREWLIKRLRLEA